MTPGDALRAQALFLAILETAVADAIGKPTGINGNQRATIVHAARSWFRAGRARSSDFRTVCDLAGVAPDPIRAAVLAEIDRLESAEAEAA